MTKAPTDERLQQVGLLTVEVSTRYYNDYENRADGIGCGSALRRSVKRTKVMFTGSELRAFVSDLRYYAAMKGTADYEYNADLVDSAFRVLATIERTIARDCGEEVESTYKPKAAKAANDERVHDEAFTKESLLKAMTAALREHGLTEQGWTAAVDTRSTRRYGVCRYRERRIEVAWKIARLNPAAETQDTILHEVAHALAGPGAGHGDKWKAKCIDIGARPVRCYDAKDVAVPGNWAIVCTGCGAEYPRAKKPRKDYEAHTHRASMCRPEFRNDPSKRRLTVQRRTAHAAHAA